MLISPVRSLEVSQAPASTAGEARVQRSQPASRGMPMVRVVEGELLDKRAGAAGYDVARRWLLNNAARGDATVDGDLYARRAHLAIVSYLDTAFDRRGRNDIRAGLDLYA